MGQADGFGARFLSTSGERLSAWADDQIPAPDGLCPESPQG